MLSNWILILRIAISWLLTIYYLYLFYSWLLFICRYSMRLMIRQVHYTCYAAYVPSVLVTLRTFHSILLCPFFHDILLLCLLICLYLLPAPLPPSHPPPWTFLFCLFSPPYARLPHSHLLISFTILFPIYCQSISSSPILALTLSIAPHPPTPLPQCAVAAVKSSS